MTNRTRNARTMLAVAALAALVGCAHGPDPLGAATETNITRQAIDPSPEYDRSEPVAGGQGGRAGRTVDALRQRTNEGGDR